MIATHDRLHRPVLVLNASYEPINICAARRALVLILKGVALMIDTPGLREVGIGTASAGMADTFPDILELAEDWSFERLRRSGLVHEYLLKEARRVFPGHFPEVRHVTPSNMSELMAQSASYRKTVRGESVGALN